MQTRHLTQETHLENPFIFRTLLDYGIECLKWVLKIPFYSLTSVTVSLYCLTYLSEKTPEEALTQREAWWGSMTDWQKGLSIVFSVSSLVMRTFSAVSYGKTFFEQFKQILKESYKKMTRFLANFFNMLLSMTSATAISFLSYKGFLWGGKIPAFVIAGVSLLIGAMQNFVAINGFIDIFSRDKRFRKACIADLNRLHPEVIAWANKHFSNALSKEMNEQAIIDFFTVLHQHQLELDNENKSLFLDPNCKDDVLKVITFLCDYSIACICAFTSYMYFAQLSFYAIDVVSPNNHDIYSLPQAIKNTIVFLPGFTHFLFSFWIGCEIRKTLVDVMDAIKKQDMLYRLMMTVGALLIIATGGFATTTNLAIAGMIIHDPINLFSLKPNTVFSDIFMVTSFVCTLSFLIDPMLHKLISYGRSKSPVDDTSSIVQTVKKWLDNKNNPLPSGLKTHSFFAKQEKKDIKKVTPIPENTIALTIQK